MLLTVTFRWYLVALFSPSEKGQIKSLETAPPPSHSSQGSVKEVVGIKVTESTKEKQKPDKLIDCTWAVGERLLSHGPEPNESFRLLYETSGGNQLCVFLTKFTQTRPDGFY